MTANTAALVQRMRDALEAAMGDLVEPRATWGLGAVNAASTAIAAADRWLAEQPVQAVAQPLTDKQIDAILSTAIPGGSCARDWFLPHETDRGLANIREVVRLMVERAYGIGQPAGDAAKPGA